MQEIEFSDEHSSFSWISWIVQWRFCFLKREFLSQRNYVVHLWRQRSCNQDDHERQKSYIDTCLQVPQDCSWLVTRQNYFGVHDPNQILKSTNSMTWWRKIISPLNGYGGTRYSGFCHRRRCGDIKRTQYFFCWINFIQRKSEQEFMDDVKSSTRDNMDDIDTHSLTWRIFMTSSKRAVIFLDRDYFAKSARHHKYRWEVNCKEIVRCDTETDSRTNTGNLRSVRTTSPWERLSLKNDEEIINLSKTKVYVFSDSVLCLGKVRAFPQSNDEWRVKLEWFMQRIG